MASPTAGNGDAEAIERHKPSYAPFSRKPIEVHPHFEHIVSLRPWNAPLLIHNEQSEVRDFCANERTFLSYLRLAVYLAIVAVAIILSFHLSNKPSPAERVVALPLGIVFGVLAIGAFVNGIVRYLAVVEGYGRRKAVVQSGVGTQIMFGILVVVIVGTCIFFLVVD